MIEFAVVPPGSVGLLQVEDGHPALGGERLHVAPEPVADLFQEGRRRNREPKVLSEKGHHLSAHLQVGNVGVEK